MASRISVVVSQSPSKNPVKRKLEEDIVAGLLFEPGIDVTIVPNLYDIKPDSTSLIALKGIGGNMIVCSWLFERAAHWVLDRHSVHGHVGTVLLQPDEDSDEEDDRDAAEDDKSRVIDSRDIPNRKIYCLDFKVSDKADDYIAEVKRIHAENAVQLVGLADILSSPPLSQNGNGQNGISQNGNGAYGSGLNGNGSNGQSSNGNGVIPLNGNGQSSSADPAVVNRVEDSDAGRRWYPVIDYSRCTNCMECIDFCLFGVYGVDRIDTILVEQPDNCRKGCPACSRVCPENAIMFPQHKTPAIAGSMDATASLKIDLSQLFGAPESGKSASEMAALERDEQLLLAGRDAVGMSETSDENVGLARRQTETASPEKDDLDDLVDELNDLDL